MFCRAFPGHSVWQVIRHKVQQICEKAAILKIHFDRYVCKMEFLKDNYHREVVPKAGANVSPGVTWQCLETFLVVETGQGAITGSGWRPGMLLHVLDWTAPPPRRIWPQMLTVPRLRTRVQTTGFGVRQVGFNHGPVFHELCDLSLNHSRPGFQFRIINT